MTKHTYSLFARLVYRWANIPVTMILLFYLYVYGVAMFHNWYYVLAALLNATVLYAMNKHYIKAYTTFPYKVSIDNEKMICEDFMLSDKKVTIYLKDIDNITGSIFSGNKARPLYIHDSKQGVQIGLRVHLKGYDHVVTTILSNIKKDLYESLLESVKEFNQAITEKRKKHPRKNTKKPVK